MANTKLMTPEQARAEYQRRWETRRHNKRVRLAETEAFWAAVQRRRELRNGKPILRVIQGGR